MHTVRTGIFAISLLAFCSVSQSQIVVDNKTLATAPSTQKSAVPRLIKFSGTMPGSGGRSGAAAVVFSIYAEQTGGAALWLETQSISVDKGRYSVLLGSGQPEGIPSDLFLSGEARWLGVRILVDGEPEQPRTMLVSVPYALKSASFSLSAGRAAWRWHSTAVPGDCCSKRRTRKIRTIPTRTAEFAAAGITHFAGGDHRRDR